MLYTFAIGCCVSYGTRDTVVPSTEGLRLRTGTNPPHSPSLSQALILLPLPTQPLGLEHTSHPGFRIRGTPPAAGENKPQSRWSAYSTHGNRPERALAPRPPRENMLRYIVPPALNRIHGSCVQWASFVGWVARKQVVCCLPQKVHFHTATLRCSIAIAHQVVYICKSFTEVFTEIHTALTHSYHALYPPAISPNQYEH